MRSTMGRTLAAGSAVVFFVAALVAVFATADRIAAGAALIGLTLLSLAVLAHVSESRSG